MTATKPAGLPSWLRAVGLVLMLTLATVGIVQWRQVALLQQIVQTQDDYLIANLYQIEIECLHLREMLALEAQGATNQRETLQLRYDIFVSRVALMQTERVQRLFQNEPGYPGLLRQLGAFVQRADLYMGAKPRASLNPQAAQVLLADLKQIDASVHQTLIAGSHAVAAQVAERSEVIQRHIAIGIGLTVFLSAMVLLFALIAMRQMRQLESRRDTLQAAAERLHRAQLLAESASRAKSAFLANMSHEIRTPFHGLLGMLSLLGEGRLDAGQQDHLRTASASAQHLMKLLDDVLDMSKLESGTLELQPGPVDLAGLLTELESLLRPQAQQKNLALQLDLAADLPRNIHIDGTRLRQIVLNLLSNAIKFTDTGSVSLSARRLRMSGQPDRLELEVVDTGSGMDSSTQERLFQRFMQADDTRTRRHGGTGLGLEISRNLARLMGGDIGVRSTVGSGSCFTVQLPLVETALAPAAEPLAHPEGGRSLHILVAEDHPINRKYLAALLERLGHKTRFVENGLEAVQSLSEHPVDLVLMDVHMPVLDGIGATRMIRALPGAAGRAHIVALTADAYADTRERCLVAGMNEVLTKPVSLQELKVMLLRHGGSIATAPVELDPAAPAAVAGVAEPPLLDRATLDQLNDLMTPPRAAALYDTFFGQAAEAAHHMRDAMRNADAQALRQAALGVNGAAAHLGLQALAESAAALNRQAADLGASQLALAVQRFEEMVNASRSLCAAEGLVQG